MSNALKISAYQQPARILETQLQKSSRTPAVKPSTTEFKEILSSELGIAKPLQFSKHAAQRLESRNLVFGSEELTKIENGLAKAEKSGSKETLVLTNDAALLVAVKSRTVVTVFDRDTLRNGVVTAIDSALII
jgi:flagellar operon protein